MTTYITELAQRDKFEAWWERTQHNGNPPRFGWEYWREGEGYKVDDDDSELDGMWSAWKAAGDELVEALSSEKRICATWRKTATAVSEKLEKAHQCITELKSGKVGNALLERENHHVEVVGKLTERIAELESRTVKLPDLRQIVSGDRYVWSDGVYNYSQDVKVALAIAGIKVEVE